MQFPSNQTEPNQKKKKKIDLLSNIMLEVTTNFVPARFSTARLLQKPIRLTIRPIKKHNSHFINMYWKTCTLLLPLQSCLNNSFSKILFNTQTNTKIFTISAIVFSFKEEGRRRNILIVEALDWADFGADDGDLRGGVWSGPLNGE